MKAYTEEQKNIIKYFRDNHSKPKGNEFVLFWSPEASESGVEGFMPLSKRYGFIFEPEKQADLNRTVAHELGHGAFALRHTWDVFESITKGASKNLMDYDGGLELWKWQWDLIQNPAPMVGFENEDEEGMSQLNLMAINVSELLSDPNQAYGYFLSIDGKIIPVASTGQVSFTGKTHDNTIDESIAKGVLLSFRNSNSEMYFGGSKKDGNFYYKQKVSETEDKIFTITDISIPSTVEVIVGVEVVSNCTLNIKRATLSNTSSYNGGGPLITAIPSVFNSVEVQKTYEVKNCEKEFTCEDLVTKLKADPKYAPFFIEGSTINTAIEKNPCILQGMYTYGEGLGYETDFWKGIKVIFGELTETSAIIAFSAMVGPAMIELSAPYLVGSTTTISEWAATQAGRKVIKEELESAVKAIAVEIGVQMAFNMILEPFFSEEPVADLTFQKVAEA